MGRTGLWNTSDLSNSNRRRSSSSIQERTSAKTSTMRLLATKLVWILAPHGLDRLQSEGISLGGLVFRFMGPSTV